jgi:hypothetical protein
MAGRSPLSADRNHFHHMLMSRMRVRYALLVYLGLLAAPGIAVEINWYLAVVTSVLSIAIYAMIVFPARERVQARSAPFGILASAPFSPARPYWRAAVAPLERDTSSVRSTEQQEIA